MARRKTPTESARSNKLTLAERLAALRSELFGERGGALFIVAGIVGIHGGPAIEGGAKEKFFLKFTGDSLGCGFDGLTVFTPDLDGTKMRAHRLPF